MEIIPTILISVLSGGVVFIFGQSTIRLKERDDEKKKLNKLLFHLLIIRKVASSRLHFNELTKQSTKKMISILKEKIGISDEDANDSETKELFKQCSIILEKSIFQNLIEESTTSNKSVKILIEELSEIKPLFALTLKDFDIEEKHKLLKNYLNEANQDNEEDVQKVIQPLMPKLELELVNHIDEIIHDVTEKLDRKTQKEVQELLINYDNNEIDENELENFVDEYIFNPLIHSFTNN